MQLPGSLYEAIVQGFAGTGSVEGRRALFLFVVDHSDAMRQPFAETGRSRLESVVGALNDMKSEMAQVDRGEHLDLGFLGYPTEPGERRIGSLWSGGAEDGGTVRRVNSPGTIVAGAPASSSNGAACSALEEAARAVSDWKGANSNPIVPPAVIHVIPVESAPVPGVERSADSVTREAGACLFHCCFDEAATDNVVVPAPGALPPGIASQLYDLSSDMPPLVEDVGHLMQGHVTPRLRERIRGFAESRGVPGFIASLGADALAGAAGGGVRLPTGRPGWSMGVGAKVEGLRIESNRGFALVKGFIGFRIFTRLFN